MPCQPLPLRLERGEVDNHRHQLIAGAVEQVAYLSVRRPAAGEVDVLNQQGYLIQSHSSPLLAKASMY